MVVGVCQVTIFFHDNHSLKEKRRRLKSILKRTTNHFNVSGAEVAEHDKWQKGVIAFVTVGTDGSFVNSVLDKVLDFVEELHSGEIIDTSLEIIGL